MDMSTKCNVANWNWNVCMTLQHSGDIGCIFSRHVWLTAQDIYVYMTTFARLFIRHSSVVCVGVRCAKADDFRHMSSIESASSLATNQNPITAAILHIKTPALRWYDARGSFSQSWKTLISRWGWGKVPIHECDGEAYTVFSIGLAINWRWSVSDLHE